KQTDRRKRTTGAQKKVGGTKVLENFEEDDTQLDEMKKTGSTRSCLSSFPAATTYAPPNQLGQRLWILFACFKGRVSLMWLRLTWNSLYTPGWPQAHRDPKGS
ncbi:mCG144711, partial [Mus musculus]